MSSCRQGGPGYGLWTETATVCAGIHKRGSSTRSSQLLSRKIGDANSHDLTDWRHGEMAYSSSSSEPLGRETSSSSSCFLLRLDIVV